MFGSHIELAQEKEEGGGDKSRRADDIPNQQKI